MSIFRGNGDYLKTVQIYDFTRISSNKNWPSNQQMQAVISVKYDKEKFILNRLTRSGNLTANHICGSHYKKPQSIPCDMTTHVLTEAM